MHRRERRKRFRSSSANGPPDGEGERMDGMKENRNLIERASHIYIYMYIYIYIYIYETITHIVQITSI
jgi:hypothetical protein